MLKATNNEYSLLSLSLFKGIQDFSSLPHLVEVASENGKPDGTRRCSRGGFLSFSHFCGMVLVHVPSVLPFCICSVNCSMSFMAGDYDLHIWLQRVLQELSSTYASHG